jgi:hypothetical protein
MEIRLGDSDAKLYNRLNVSSLDLEFAQYCVGVILKKRWHLQPWDKRGTIYLQQSAFTSALVVACSRPFKGSRGWPKLPPGLVEFDSQENMLHSRIIDLRDSVFAHSDSKNYSVSPWQIGRFSTDIVGAPTLHISAEQAVLLKQMICKLQFAIRHRMNEIVPRED